MGQNQALEASRRGAEVKEENVDTFTISQSVTLESRVCPECGVCYAMPVDLREGRQKDHRSWYCPNGHSRFFPAQTVEEQLRRALAHAQERANALAQQKRNLEGLLAATEKAKARLARRANGGVCPHCGRTFKQVQRHLALKHPEHAQGVK